jgi:two-component system nitrogen regulation response regulator GlnG
MTDTGAKVLIVDGDEQIAWLSSFLEPEAILPLAAHTAQDALEKICSQQPDVLVADMKLPDMDGLGILRAAKSLDEDLPVILITGYPEIRGAVAAMRAGAHDYLAKPLRHHEVLRVVFSALNERVLKRKLCHLSGQVEDPSSLRQSMGPSGVVRSLIADVNRVARTNFSVLILGETGSGKELVARAIHQNSPRARAAFSAVDCGAIPETLLESELFGHEKGAYTGADRQKIGKIEMAHGGTLFLDEISNLPLGSQAKLLRVLQDKTICRVGGTQAMVTDVRVLAASNRDLQRLGESGAFRSDVYFRLNEFTLWVPPLRERQEDVLYLAKRFLDLTNAELQKNVKGFSPSAVDALLACDWPGNVRQLRSVIRRAVLLADDLIDDQHLRIDGVPPKPVLPEVAEPGETPLTPLHGFPLKAIMQKRIGALERQILAQVLRETGGNKAKAARLLHIDYKTIHSKVRQYGIPLG